MIVFNGEVYSSFGLISNQELISLSSGSVLSEYVRVEAGRIIFWEAHYFRIMSSMRILRLDIPMSFTMEYLQDQVQLALKENEIEKSSACVLFSFFLNEHPSRNNPIPTVSLLLTAKTQDTPNVLRYSDLNIDIYKDHWITKGLYGNLEPTNIRLRQLASVYAFENELEDCILLNHEKQITESIDGAVFVVKESQIKTPPLSSGCRSDVYRKIIIEIIKDMKAVELIETDISPFEIQKADELFIVNLNYGIKSIKQYRKKMFVSTITETIFNKWIVRYRLN